MINSKKYIIVISIMCFSMACNEKKETDMSNQNLNDFDKLDTSLATNIRKYRNINLNGENNLENDKAVIIVSIYDWHESLKKYAITYSSSNKTIQLSQPYFAYYYLDSNLILFRFNTPILHNSKLSRIIEVEAVKYINDDPNTLSMENPIVWIINDSLNNRKVNIKAFP